MDLYFGNLLSAISTLLVVGVFIYIGLTISNQQKIEKWGGKVAFLALWGLIICCFVAIRDSYHLSVQASMNSSIAEGVFTLESIQSTLCCIGGAIIAFCTLSSIIIRKQKYRRFMFIVLSAVMLVKTIIIEISRIIM